MPTFIIDISLTYVFEDNFISPPLSSKITKSLIEKGDILGTLAGMAISRDKFKPLFISNLYSSNGKRILSVSSGGIYRPRIIHKDIPYFGRVAIAAPIDLVDKIVDSENHQRIFSLSLGNIAINGVVSIDAVNIISIDNLRIDLSDKALIRFLTPTIIPSKIFLPPSLASKPKYKRYRSPHLLIPTVGAIIAYSIKLWNSVAPPEKRFIHPNDEDSLYIYKYCILGTVMSKIVSYKLRPVTVAIGRDKNNRIRETRGFVGKIVFRIHHKKIREIAEKTLALTRYLGIGRSRGIGLGEIEISVKDHYKVIKKEADHRSRDINDS